MNIWAEYVSNKLEEQFEVIILSGQPEQTNAPNSGETIGSSFGVSNDNRYYFVRIRPIGSADSIVPSPFSFKNNLSEARRLINMHPMAYIPVNKTIHPPAHGDIFLCRYTKKDRLSYSLIKRVRSSGKTISAMENKRAMPTMFNSNQPQRLGNIPKQQPPPSGNRPRNIKGSSLDLSPVTKEYTSYYIIGDSQAAHDSNNNLGAFMQEYIKKKNPNAKVFRTGYSGESIQVFAGWSISELNRKFPYLKEKPKVLYIFLGGNGSPKSNKNYTNKLLEKLVGMLPLSQIIWILPPPPANVKTTYLNVYPNDYKKRYEKGQAIMAAAAPWMGDLYSNLTFKNPYSAPSFAEKPQTDPKLGPYGNPDNVESDRVHVKGAIREVLLRELGLIE